MPNKAPVGDVGGTQNSGPWPSDVDDIVEGQSYNRPVTLSDGTEQEVSVTVTQVNQFTDDDGNPTTGYAISYQFDDPTL